MSNIQELEEELSYRFDTYGIPEAPSKVEVIQDEIPDGEHVDETVGTQAQPVNTLTVVPKMAATKLQSNKSLDLKHDPKDREVRIFISSPFR